jgi:hypothetical protein
VHETCGNTGLQLVGKKRQFIWLSHSLQFVVGWGGLSVITDKYQSYFSELEQYARSVKGTSFLLFYCFVQ